MSAADPAAHPARLPPGTPVAVGPGDVPAEVRAGLRALVAAGGAVAAGADVDLGHGFRSARIAGGAGDRRDAVLAVLAVPAFADRLGPPAGLLVALFGPDATRPLGTATLGAIAAGRWPVLRYAAAASDLLGPEQLVRLLDLRAPQDVDPFPAGLPSIVATHLDRVLRPLSGPRRLRLLIDLWTQVCAAGTARLRRDRLRASQVRRRRYDELAGRFERHEDDEVAGYLHRRFGPEPTLAQAALWEPPIGLWSARAGRVLNDALAATVLARLTVTAVDLGIPEALERHRHEITAAAGTITGREAADAARLVVPKLTGHPARPACYLRQILQRIPPGVPLSPKRVVYVRDRLALAFDYATLALGHARDFMAAALGFDETAAARTARETWAGASMRAWRDHVGCFAPERLAGWDHDPGGDLVPLGQRPQAETVGDYFWYAELGDAVARLRGYEAAVVTMDVCGPYADPEPEPEPGMLPPRPDSIALAAAGTAQLAELGGSLPPRARTWPELTAGLLAGVVAAEAQTGRFAVPAAADDADGTLLPGTDTRIEIARTGTQLAEWAAYMGNCIAGEYYTHEATTGRDVLLALRGADRGIVANVEVRLTGKGWRLGEMKARFNEEPDEELVRRTREWVASLPAPHAAAEPETVPDPDPAPARRARAHRPTPAARLTAELGDRLGDLAEAAIRPAEVLAALIDAPPSPAALVALRRAAPATLTSACRRLLTGGSAVELWEASGHRPLSEALSAMPATVHDRLAPLRCDVLVSRTLRKLARLPRIAPARNAELVAIRVRAALGVLLREDAPELAHAMTARPHGPLLRAAALSVTSWGGLGPAGGVTAVTARRRVRVPGYPESSLRDELWQDAWRDAVELGGVPDGFWERIAAHGLLVPSSWLTAGGWPALWARAAAR